jgi:hypothetical protein
MKNSWIKQIDVILTNLEESIRPDNGAESSKIVSELHRIVEANELRCERSACYYCGRIIHVYAHRYTTVDLTYCTRCNKGRNKEDIFVFDKFYPPLTGEDAGKAAARQCYDNMVDLTVYYVSGRTVTYRVGDEEYETRIDEICNYKPGAKDSFIWLENWKIHKQGHLCGESVYINLDNVEALE